MKSLTSNHHLITQALKSSSKLVVNEDGRKVKRKIPFTEKDREELQSRTVVVENLPDDHSHQNLEKIFGVVGRLDNRIKLFSKLYRIMIVFMLIMADIHLAVSRPSGYATLRNRIRLVPRAISS
ncbi:La-related protein 6C [Linum perenne]